MHVMRELKVSQGGGILNSHTLRGAVMEFISWEEAKEITENYFMPYKCVVDADKSDHQNLIPFAIYYDHTSSSDRYGPYEITQFNKRDRLEYALAAHKENFKRSLTTG